MELIVKLRQHTPLIHFQWDQEGATLRASEVKPKLDKFLKEKNISSLKDIFGNKGNLPYKLVVISTDKIASVDEIEKDKKDGEGKILYNNKGKPIKIPFPPFFGNIEKIDRGNIEGTGEKKLTHYKFVVYNDVRLKFISFVPEVITEIEKNLAEFFFLNNFGARQSKGFGSFYIDPANRCYKNPNEFSKYYFTLEVKGNDLYSKYKDLFASIDLFYRSLRSGINIKYKDGKTFYFKSIMFLYAKSKGWTWDKKAIKEKFFDPKTLDDQKKAHNNPDILTFSGAKEYLVRDLLGVAPLQNYLSYGSKNKKISVQYDKANEIQRFKSPITFKPLEDSNKCGEFSVFIILNEIPSKLFDKNFKINKVVVENKKERTEDSFNLKTPPITENFDTKDFLDFALEKVNIDKHVDQESKKHENFSKIKQIYEELKIRGDDSGK